MFRSSIAIDHTVSELVDGDDHSNHESDDPFDVDLENGSDEDNNMDDSDEENDQESVLMTKMLLMVRGARHGHRFKKRY